MKKINKLILVLIIGVIGLFFANSKDLYAYGILYQSWVQESGENSYVLYRTYTTPHPSTITAYAGYTKKDVVYRSPGVKATYSGGQSKWAYANDNSSLNAAPGSHGIFQTYGLLFHGNSLVGSYTPGGSNYSYATFSGAISDVSTLNTNIYDNVTINKLSGVSSSKGSTTDMLIKSEYLPLDANKIAYSLGATDPGGNYDPWFRMALISESESNRTHPIYVTDRKLTSADLNGISSGANDNKLFFDYGTYKKCIRVSNMIRAKSYSNSGQDSMKDPWLFYNQGPTWSNDTRGLPADNHGALSSVINLYDNILIFPGKAKRTVKYRYVNIGETEDLSTEAVEAAITKDETIDVVSDYKIATLKNDNTVTIQNTDGSTNGSTNPYIGQEYLGYNVGNMDTEEKAQNIIKTKVAAHSVDSKETSYTTPAFKEQKDETIIVEIYYRDKVSGFNEVHTYYDSNGNKVDQKRIKYDTDGNGDPIENGSTRTVSKLDDANYAYIGAYKSKSYEANPPMSSYDSTLNNIKLEINESDSTKNYQFANFGYQQSTDVIEKHIIYYIASDGTVEGPSDMVEPISHKVTKNTNEVLTNKASGSMEYLGVTRRAVGESPPDSKRTSYTNTPTTTLTSSDIGQTIYFGYSQKEVNIFVRHILFDANGENPRVLSQHKTSVTSDTTIDEGGMFASVTIDYKGFIKTNNGDDFPSIRAYLKPDSPCIVTLKEVKKGEVWVNYLYKIKPIEESIDKQPDIDIKAKLDFETDASIQTESCKSSVYKTNSVLTAGLEEGGWEPILSIPINTELKFGIISQPKYIIGAVRTERNVVNVEAYESNIKKGFLIKTIVTAHGINNREETRTITNSYKFVFPYKYSQYYLREYKLFKVDEANVYVPGFSHNKTVGEKLFGDTEKYNYKYSLGDKTIEFKEGLKYNIPLLGMDYELYIDPSQYGKTAETLPNKYVAKPYNMADPDIDIQNGVNTISLLLNTGIGLIAGVETVVDNTPTITETVHVYPSGPENFEELEDLEAYGDWGAYKYKVLDNNDQLVDMYLEVENQVTIRQLARTFWEKLKVAIVNFLNWLKEQFTGEPGTLEYDADEELAILEGLIQNVNNQLNGTKTKDGIRDVIYSLKLNTTTQQSFLKIDDTVIAQNNAAKNEEISIDSGNFNAKSTRWYTPIVNFVYNIIQSYGEKSYDFPGYIDVSETGIMTITPTGRKYYTEGFSPIADLNEEKEVKDPKKFLTDTVNEKAKNGIRLSAADVKYLANNNKLFSDNLYYSNLSSEGTIYTFESTRNSYTKNINKDQTLLLPLEKAVKIVNVYTPMKVKGDDVKDLQIEEPETQLTVPMADSGITSRLLLETGFCFYIGVDDYPYAGGEHHYPNIGPLKDYLKSFYVKFDFDIKEFTVNGDGDHTGIKVNGSDYKGGVVSADTWIKINLSEILAKTPGTDVANLKVTSKSKDVVVGKASYTVRALAKNIEDLEKPSLKASLASFYESYRNICNDEYPVDPYTADSPVYYDEKKVEINVKNVERLYDFEVSDVKDIDWKNVFRSGISHNGKVYYSGANRWQDGVKEALNRSTRQIGTNPSRILPVGPFKHTDTTYKNAPKMGYRISFDVKLTGGYNGTDQKVLVKPSFYYISKDGKTFNDQIELYYKDSGGKYVKVGSTEDKYKLTFVPNDGYRYLDSNNLEHLSNKKLSLGKLNGLELVADGMSTEGDGYLTFYGEYKLPNSTIVVKTGDSISDTSKYLKDGYLGVKFDISYKDPTIVAPFDPTITYSTGMKKVTANPAAGVSFAVIKDTSQWEFEGYMGMKYENSTKTVDLKLEKGTWTIDNAMYQKVRGTVVLFDLDARAASDFN